MFGNLGQELNHREYYYEIGSITKTFTTPLLVKAVSEGKVNLEDSVRIYLGINKDYYVPSFKRLATHTAGLGEAPIKISLFQALKSLLLGLNQLCGYTNKDLIKHYYLNITHKEYAELEKDSIDKAGLGWIIDTKNQIYWHNGGTGSYRSFLGFDKK